MFTFIWFSVQNSCSFSKELVTKTESSWSCQTFFFSFCLVAKFLSPHYSHTFLTSLFFSFFLLIWHPFMNYPRVALNF